MAGNASKLKIEKKFEKLGARVVLHGNSFEEAEVFAKTYAHKNEL